MLRQGLGALGASAESQVHEELLVAGRSGDGRGRLSHADEADGGCVDDDASDDGLVHLWIGHQAAFSDLVPSGLELRLHERDDV